MKLPSPVRICAAFALSGLVAGCAAPGQKGAGPTPLFPNGIPVGINGPIGFPEGSAGRDVPVAQGKRDYIVRDPIL